VLPVHGVSSTQNGVEAVATLHEAWQVTLVYLTPTIGTMPIAPQHVCPDGQSAGTLHASGASHARVLHDELGIVGDEV
jgi:hypothetical protein